MQKKIFSSSPSVGQTAKVLSTHPCTHFNLGSWVNWSPDGKLIAYSPEVAVKVRPESTIWEVDFEEIVDKLAPQE